MVQVPDVSRVLSVMSLLVPFNSYPAKVVNQNEKGE
jgi:hypothetical protein